MVLPGQLGGRVGRRRDQKSLKKPTLLGAFCVFEVIYFQSAQLVIYSRPKDI